MKFFLPAFVLSCAFLASGASAYRQVLHLAQESEVVVVAEVIELRDSRSFAFWSGTAPSIVHVRYRVIEVLKGRVKSSDIDAGHYVVDNSLTADEKEPRLSPKLFQPGNRLVLILSRENRDGCKRESPEVNVEAFCSPNENYGAVLAESKLVDKLRSRLQAR